jgi:uncharacterized membrane protein
MAGEESPQRWETGRVEAFSDGVFAIAITLLVLEISINPSDYDHLRRALLHEWPAYLSYITSFLTVGSVWIAHHNLFSRLKYIDPVLLRLNLLLLLAAAFLPFPTGVLAESFHASEEAERTAVVFYGGVALVIELLLRACVRHADARPYLAGAPQAPGAAPPPPPGRWSERSLREFLSAWLYAAAILVGVFVFPRAAAAGYLIVALRGVLVIGREGRLSLGRVKH